MATAVDAPCLTELAGLPSWNASFGIQPCNRSARNGVYTPSATAAFALAITFMMMVTIVGNILVIIAVLTSRSLKGPQNLFLVSLAAADILVATLIIPFSLANELQGYWAFSAIWCEIYLALDVLFCSSSIVHLCAIALDRYLSISRPVSYGPKRTASRIKAAIVVVWLISAVISFPPLLSLDKSEAGEDMCELNDERWYILYSSVGSFFAPCVIMILVYVRIYQIAKQHARCPLGHKSKSEDISDVFRKSTERRNDDEASVSSQKDNVPDSQVAQRCNLTGLSSCPVPKIPLVALKKNHTKRQRSQSEVLSAHSSGSEADTNGGMEEDKGLSDPPVRKGLNAQMKNLAVRYKSTMATSAGTRLVIGTPRTPGMLTTRRKALLNREKRFTFVLAVVMGVFVMCWFPFFLSYSLKAICPESCSIPVPLFKFFFWIGYCNSCLNPVIYTIFNKDFRKAFKRILCRNTKGTFF
ncbi:alpha-2B adrenergic receptor [Synchiropus picturatus]